MKDESRVLNFEEGCCKRHKKRRGGRHGHVVKIDFFPWKQTIRSSVFVFVRFYSKKSLNLFKGEYYQVHSEIKDKIIHWLYRGRTTPATQQDESSEANDGRAAPRASRSVPRKWLFCVLSNFRFRYKFFWIWICFQSSSLFGRCLMWSSLFIDSNYGFLSTMVC